jgi:hypothetical protein
MSTGMPDTASAVAGTVVVHVGVPKTGTTFLQSILHQQRRALRRAGVLYPGPRRAHLFEAVDLMGGRFPDDPMLRFPGSWAKLVTRVQRWPGTAVISHEILSEATVEAVDRAMDDLAGREIHVVCTARDLASTLRGAWQESVKNGSGRSLDDFVAGRRRHADGDPLVPHLRTSFQDPAHVLARWARHLDSQHVHVVTVPRSRAGSGELWVRFAAAVGIPVELGDVEVVRSNASLGLPETEFLRHLNRELGEHPAVTRELYRREVKSQLAARLAERSSSPVRLSAEQHSWAQQLSRATVATIAAQGYQVHGDLDDLVPPDAAADAPAPVTLGHEEVGVAAAAALLDRIAALRERDD